MENSITLSRAQAYSSIFAAVALPVIIAGFGWYIQNKISDESTRKDYVQMALNILNAEKKDADKEMRIWAVAVLDKTSPVPFPKEIKKDLAEGKAELLRLGFPMPPPIFMEPPKQLLPLKVPDGQQVTNGDLLNNTLDNYAICEDNALRLGSLQKVIQNYEKFYNTGKAD